jgi:hypothetical protein
MTINDTKTLEQFMTDNNIRMGKVERVIENKNAPDWTAANHYKVTLLCGNRRFTTYFSQGYAHTSGPKAADVLDCLASDVSGFINARSFEEWCGEYGYDTDSRKAERTYRVIESQKDKMKQWLGSFATLEELCFNTERL